MVTFVIQMETGAASIERRNPLLSSFLRLLTAYLAGVPPSSHSLCLLLSLDFLTHVMVRVERASYLPSFGNKRLTKFTDAAWPHLREFEFSVGAVTDTKIDPDDRHCLPSPYILARFAERHPLLERLVLPAIDLGEPDTGIYVAPEKMFGRVLESPLPTHNLQVLKVCIVEDVPTQRLRAFATYIDKLFPNLDLDEEMRSSRLMLGAFDHWWDVEQFLFAIRTGRKGTHHIR